MFGFVDLSIINLLLELVQNGLLLGEIGHGLLSFLMDSFVEGPSLGMFVCEEILMCTFSIS